MKTSDEKLFLSCMTKLGVKIKKFTEREYMYNLDKLKQDVEYSINSYPDIGFHFKKGKFLGTTSSGINSFEKRG